MRERVTATLIAGLALSCLSGCGDAPAPPPPSPPEVQVATPQVRDVAPTYTYGGTTEAFASVEIRARVQGYLDEIRFTPSTMVDEGQVLFVLERAPFVARRDRARANLASAEAALRRTESDLERLEQAVRTNAVSQQEVTRARAERDQAEAALAGARADLDTAEIDLAYTTLDTPVAGLVSRNYVDPGNLVGPSINQLLATVRRIDPIFAYFEVDERRFSRILAGRGGYDTERGTAMRTVLRVPETDIAVEGTIDSIDNTVDRNTGTILIRAAFANAEAVIFPGQFVLVEIEGDPLTAAVVIDEKALGSDLGGRYLLLVGDGNVVEQRYVTLGPVAGDGMIVVSDGLAADERYIVEGLLRARPGLPVTPREAPAAGS